MRYQTNKSDFIQPQSLNDDHNPFNTEMVEQMEQRDQRNGMIHSLKYLFVFKYKTNEELSHLLLLHCLLDQNLRHSDKHQVAYLLVMY